MATTAGYAPSLHLREETTFTSLKLGPIARSQTLIDSTFPAPNYSLQSASSNVPPTSSVIKYPRIVVKDPSGRTLDTFTALQEAIYRASWNRKKMGEWPKTSLEWRLPKAPVPSKPDYSRAGPRSLTSLNNDRDHLHQRTMTSLSHDLTSTTNRIHLATDLLVNIPTLEIAVEDVAFVAESLNHLPNLPSFSFLRQSILAGQSTYIQIVASILLHQKQIRATQQRAAEWQFPGFCTGCKRAGFCYGCSKNPKPHIHEDIPAKIGGGFRFWKRDRPYDAHNWKHPGSWLLPTTDKELRNIIEKYGGLSAYEHAYMRAKREMSRTTIGEDVDDSSSVLRLQRLTNLGTYPPYVTIVRRDDNINETNKEEFENGGESLETSATSKKSRDQTGRQKRVSIKDDMTRSASLGSHLSEDSIDRTLVRVDTGYFEDVLEEDKKRDGLSKSIEDLKEANDKGERESSRGRVLSRTQTTISLTHSESSGSHKRGVAVKVSTADKKKWRLEFADKEKELEEEEAMRLRREQAKQSVPFGTKREDVGYTAPKFFTVQKQSRKITVAKDPFSTDRDLNVPKGPKFQLKKSDKKATQFVDFKRGDRDWEAPKKFEIKKEDKSKVKSLTGTEKAVKTKGTQEDSDDQDSKSGRHHRQDRSPDSGLDSARTDGRDGKDGTGIGLDFADGPKTDNGRSGENEDQGIKVEKPKRKETVKKTREKTKTPESPPRLLSPPMYRREISSPLAPSPIPSPAPEAEEPPLPEIEIPAIPDLPEIEEKTQTGKRKEKLKFIVEPPPQPLQVKEEPKKRKAPPKVRVIPKNLYKARRSRPAEAPVTSEELMEIHDPLDFLAKWCIINPDRLPFYELVYESAIADQTPRYQKPAPSEQREVEEVVQTEEEEKKEEKKKDSDEKEEKKKEGKSKKKKSNRDEDEGEKGRELKQNLLPTGRGMNLVKSTMTVEEQHMEKLIYTLDLLQEKMVALGNSLEEHEAKRIKMLADKARETFPLIGSVNYSPNKKKGKKGKKKEDVRTETPKKLKPDEITDQVIVERLDDKMLKELCREQDMKFLDGEIEILRDKVREVQRRVEDIAREKLLTDAFCMNHYFMRQGIQAGNKDDFKRQQSELYNRLHPTPDFEMNLEEVEEALQQINNHLLTKKEFHFLYNVLNLPGREKINFRLFTVIAALSEKVTQLDPVIRKMINSSNYNALDIKMEKCKELFDLLDMDHMPRGAAQAESLAVELTAGGLRPEHTRYVLNKFNRESKGVIDFLDFVTYVPLFVEIHKRIVQDPLKEDLDL